MRVLCPVDGTVWQTGGPDDDWYLRVQPASKPPDLRHLLCGDEVRAWVGRELERLQIASRAMVRRRHWPMAACWSTSSCAIYRKQHETKSCAKCF